MKRQQDEQSQNMSQNEQELSYAGEESQSLDQNMSIYDDEEPSNPMDPINRERQENQLRFQNPNPHNLPEYPYQRLYDGMTDKEKKELDKRREEIIMREQPPNPSDFAELRQIYAGLSDDRITPALDYINEKGELKRRPDDQIPLPTGSNAQGGLQLPNYVIGAKVNQYTVKQLYKKPETSKVSEAKAAKKEYIEPQKQNLKDGLKDTKDTKGGNKQTKDYIKGTKDNQSVVKDDNYGHSVKDGKHFEVAGIKTIKSEQGAQGLIKSERDRERIELSSGNKEQEQLVNLFCHYQGDLLLIARALNRKSVSSVCRQLNPIITEAIRNLENVIIRRKIRRMAIRWADSELKRFRHKFYEIKDGKLYGCEKRVRLGPLYKLMKMKYDRSITITNEQANQLYEGCLDLNLAIDEDTKARTNWNTQSVVWTHAEIKFFCRLILKTNDYQAISNELIKEFGGVKEKFAPSKLVVKLDSLLKGSLKKLKHLALEYEDLPTLCRVEGKDFRNICYGTHFEFSKVRKAIIEFFLASNPPKEEIGRILHIVNMFLEESRKYEENRSKRTKLEMNINDLKKQYTEEELERLRIQKALAHPEYMRTPRDIYFTERNNVKYEDEDVSIIPKGNAQELERRLREIKEMQRQRYLKLQEEKKLLESNNDRGRMMSGMRKPGLGSSLFETHMKPMNQVRAKIQNPMARSAFDSDDEDDNIRSLSNKSNVKLDYEARPGSNQQLSSAMKSNPLAKKEFDDKIELQQPGRKTLPSTKMNTNAMNSSMGQMPKNTKPAGKHPLDFDSDDSFDLGPSKANQPKPNYGNFNNFKKGPMPQQSNPQSMTFDTASQRSSQLNQDIDNLSELENELDNIDALSMAQGSKGGFGNASSYAGGEGMSDLDEEFEELNDVD